MFTLVDLTVGRVLKQCLFLICYDIFGNCTPALSDIKSTATVRVRNGTDPDGFKCDPGLGSRLGFLFHSSDDYQAFHSSLNPGSVTRISTDNVTHTLGLRCRIKTSHIKGSKLTS